MTCTNGSVLSQTAFVAGQANFIYVHCGTDSSDSPCVELASVTQLRPGSFSTICFMRHRKTLMSLEQLILQHKAHKNMIQLKNVKDPPRVEAPVSF